ncbi:MAG: exo-rhamnogalacturonan lyase family protein, partial [Planctomycetota bacterium]
MTPRLGPLSLTLCAILGFSAASSGELSVKLTVTEPAGLPRKTEPACGGVPLPAATFKKDQQFAVYSGGAELPAQVLPLVVDRDGFLRWVLVDVQVDLAAGGKKELVLRAAEPAARPASPLKVADGAAGVTVDTGKVKFTVSREKPFGLFSSVEAGGKALVSGGEVSYVDITAAERRSAGSKPEQVAVEYAGPMRATVFVRGRFSGDDDTRMRYVARITAWAGRSDVHVKYSLANSNHQNYTWRHIKDSSVRLTLAAESTATLLGAGKPLETAPPAWMAQSARVFKAAIHGKDSLGDCPWFLRTPGAKAPGGAKAMSGEKELWTSSGKGDVSEGWIAARTASGTLAIHDLFFADDPPRRLAAEKNALVLSGVSTLLPGTKSPFGDSPRWLMDCSHVSSQYLIDFQSPAAPAEISAAGRAARARLHVMAPPAWYFQTEALPAGRFGTQEDELACYRAWGWQFDPKAAPSGPARIYRNMPRWVVGDDNHYTSEQDTLEALSLMYLRTGSRKFMDAAETWANYFMDLQCPRTDGWRWKDGGVWWTWRGSPVGNAPQRGADPVVGMRNRLVKPGRDRKAGKHSVKDRPVELKIDLSEAALADIHLMMNAKACHCHNWGEGIATWFLLTGDRDALDAAVDCAEQNYDTQARGLRKEPGKLARFSRDFTRSCYLVNAARMCLPKDD